MTKKIKKLLIGVLFSCLMCTVALLAACGEKFTVTFDTDGGTEVPAQVVSAEGVVKQPEDPTKDGYEFVNWLLDGVEYNFETPVTADITLTASYVPSASCAYTLEYFDVVTNTKVGSKAFNNGVVGETIVVAAGDLFTADDGKVYIVDNANANNSLKKEIKADGSTTFKVYANYSELYTDLEMEDVKGFAVTRGAEDKTSEVVLQASKNKMNTVYTRKSGNAFLAKMDLTYRDTDGSDGGTDNGTGFTVKDSDGNILNFMFVNWGTGKLCLQYSNENMTGSRFDYPTLYKAKNPAANVQVELTLAYDGNQFVIYEDGIIRNTITLDEIDEKVVAARGKFTAGEALQTGFFGFRGNNTEAKIENVGFEFTDAQTVAAKNIAHLKMETDGTPINTLGIAIASEKLSSAAVDFSAFAPQTYGYNNVGYFLDSANSTLNQPITAGAQFVAKYVSNDFSETFAVESAKNYAFTNSADWTTTSMTVPARNTQCWIQSRAKGNAFIARMDYTYLGNESDNGSGFRMVDSDGNSINFMLVTWSGSTMLCVNFNGSNTQRKLNTKLYSYVKPLYGENTQVEQTLTYYNGVFTLWENDFLRNTFTLAELTATWGGDTASRFSATEDFHVGFYTHDGPNSNGKFENMSVEFVTDAAKKTELNAWYNYMNGDHQFTDVSGWRVMRTGTGNDFSVDESKIEYVAENRGYNNNAATDLKTHTLWSKTSGTSATIEATIQYNHGDAGIGFMIKDADGNTVNMMFVNWGGDGYLCVQTGLGSGNRWHPGPASSGSAIVPAVGTTVRVKMTYSAGTITIYEKPAAGTSEYVVRNTFTLAQYGTAVSGAATVTNAISATEPVFVGVYGSSAWVNTKGIVSNVSYSFN